MGVLEGIDGTLTAECEMQTAARDGCVVDSAPLAGLLIPFIDEWTRRYPSVGGRYLRNGQRAETEMPTATGYLSAKSGVSERTIQNITRRDKETGAPSPSARTTELRIADPLVAAIDRTEVFFDGTLPVHPNPRAHPTVRASCCSAPHTHTLLGA
jgi:hypothetical protein